VKEQTGKMQDQIDSFAIDNENLKERSRDNDKKMVSLEEKLNDADRRSASFQFVPSLYFQSPVRMIF
jgi:predicted RNase H-like nuclease (RuvC/YqgF family)